MWSSSSQTGFEDPRPVVNGPSTVFNGHPEASVIIVSYNGLNEIKRCLPSLINQSYPSYEILLVDNGSSDGSPEYVEQSFPQVRVIRNHTNLGYAGGNNKGFESAKGDYLVALNQDTVVDREWLSELIKAMEYRPNVALATSKICYLSEKNVINTCGNDVNFTGLAFCRGIGQPADNFNEEGVVPAISGCAFAVRRSVLDHIGGFDDDFFLYLEDTDLSIRARLAGYECLYVPTSVAYHDYAFNLNSSKFFFLEKNRYILLLKNFRWSTLVLMAPALLLTEGLTFGYGVMHGWSFFSNKLRAYKWLLANLPKILKSRSRVQALRARSDREMVQGLSFQIPFNRLTSASTFERLLQALTYPLFRFFRGILIFSIRE